MYDLQFEPKKEEELTDLLEKGEGNYEVIDATRKDSKSNGNPMIELKLKVWDKAGNQGFIYDYLMLTASKFSMRKIRHFCYSCGLENMYDSGKLNATDCIGKSGKLTIGFKEAEGSYHAKNTVADYTVSNGQAVSGSKDNVGTETFNDDIPF